jgi:hypothetical protein
MPTLTLGNRTFTTNGAVRRRRLARQLSKDVDTGQPGGSSVNGPYRARLKGTPTVAFLCTVIKVEPCPKWLGKVLSGLADEYAWVNNHRIVTVCHFLSNPAWVLYTSWS